MTTHFLEEQYPLLSMPASLILSLRVNGAEPSIANQAMTASENP